MYALIKEEIRGLLKKASGESLTPAEIKESTKGDYTSTIAFKLASKRKSNPVELAKEITGEITPGGVVKNVEAVNGYINFSLDYSVIIIPLLKDLRERKSGYGGSGRKNRKVILEHTSINPSGPLHIGRVRNSLIGDSLARVLKFSGYEVETHYFVNDVGKQIAIIALGFKEGLKPDRDAIERYGRYKEKEDFKVFFEYISANKKFMEDPGFARRVQEYIKKAESGDEGALNEISDVARRCLKGQKEIFQILKIHFDRFDFESDYIKRGDVSAVLEFLRGSEYAKTSEKGFGLDLAGFGIERRGGVSILARADGTSVYLSRDVAYHLQKSKLGDLLINVFGEDHKFEFLELKTILGKIYNVKTPLEVVHYSFVNFEGEELSTRKGQTAPVDKLLEEAVSKAELEIEKRGIASKEVAPVIGIGAIKYHILKTSPQKPITFRWSEALNFEGDAAPYIQYAHARCSSIIKKSGIGVDEIDVDGIDLGLEKSEVDLIRHILKFPEVVKETASEKKPNIIANYLYKLSTGFSRFYKNCPVLPSEGKIRERRLLLVDATRQVLKNGLNLLGIEAPEKM
ncbi:MAG: arginine--tRNA ligase [Candidatus Altiarchaeota archaeon]|nr:arginine--tRNA ligase [Candidatus Altiarchaeota archaeon]